MNNPKGIFKQRLVGLVLCVLGLPSLVYAQSATDIRGLKIPVKYHEDGSLACLLWAEYARIKADFPVIIRNMRVEYYKNAEREILMTMESPKCTFHRAASRADSDSDVKIVRENMTVTGTGFTWEGTNEVFKIFNNAKVVIRGQSATDQLDTTDKTKE